MSSVVHTNGPMKSDPQLAELIAQMEEMKKDYEKQLATVEDINAQLVDEQNGLRAALEERDDRIARLEARGREQTAENQQILQENELLQDEIAKTREKLSQTAEKLAKTQENFRAT